MKKLFAAVGVGFILLSIFSCNNAGEKTNQPKTDTVIISGMKFNPETLQINKGDTVLWINNDIVEHNVTAYPDESWTSGSIGIGYSWKKVADSSFAYYCSIHPNMKGKIEIK